MTELVVVSFRGPVVHSRDESGRTQAGAASGGLVTGLLALPDLEDHGTWVCAAMTKEDRLVAEEGEVVVEVRGRKVAVRMVALEPLAQHQTSAVAANPVLWFLQHELWDLGAAWYDLTALPFVYAVWALSRGIDHGPLRRLLQEAKDFGRRLRRGLS